MDALRPHGVPAAGTSFLRPAQLFASFYKAYLRLYPSFATEMGDNQYDDLYDAWYTAGHRAAAREFIDVQRADIARTAVASTSDRLYVKGLEGVLDNEARIAGSTMHLLAVNHYDQNPFRNLLDLVDAGKQVVVSRAQLFNWKARVEGFIATLPELRENLREGIRQRVVLPRATVELLVRDLRSLSLRSIPRENVSAALRREFTWFMEKFFVPESRYFADFLELQYLPHAKASLGLFGIPGAAALYDVHRRLQVSEPTDPDAVFRLGKSLVAQISKEQAKLRGGTSHAEFTAEVLNARSNTFSSEKDMLDAYRRQVTELKHVVRADITIPKAVKSVPVVKVPSVRAAFEAQAYYRPGDMDNVDPGTFFVNTRDWAHSLRSDVTNLTLHEAMPGHGLHAQIVNLDRDVPRVYKLLQFNSLIEGWGLYCEGWEVPGSNDPLTRYSSLNAAQIRAVRLVVDVGIHAKGWSFDRCFRYMRRYLSDPDQTLRAEILRYSSMPFQAATYMLGCVRIRALRDAYLKKHKGRTLRDFHDEFMRHASLPLPLVAEAMSI